MNLEAKTVDFVEADDSFCKNKIKDKNKSKTSNTRKMNKNS